MSDEKRFEDEETQKFYEQNKDMIDRILAEQKEMKLRREAEYLEEKAKRAAFDAKIRAEYEAEKARRSAFVKADQLHDDLLDARVLTEEAFEEARDHVKEYSRKQGDYIFDLLTEEFDRVRDKAERGREFVESRYDEDKDRFKDARGKAKDRFNERFDEVFSPLTDEQFQKHVVGAGLEFWMALNALIKAAPVPDSVKEAFATADANKNKEYCAKNEDCAKRSAAVNKIKIEKKETKE